MYDLLRGIRVLEVAAWTFVPSAGAICADWGADVLKVEHPVTGDPQRGLLTRSLGEDSPDVLIEQPNRGKRSVAIDIAAPEGRELLLRLAETCDVFLTNFMPAARRRLGIDVDDVRARNPSIIYVRGTGQGTRGPDAEKGGFDVSSAWCRAGMGWKMSQAGDEPLMQPPAFVDLVGGAVLAAGVAAALFRRERDGETSVVDVSLFGVGSWMMSPDIVAAPYVDQIPVPQREDPANPIVNPYRTGDGRWIWLVMLQSDRYWPDLCRHLDRPELADDPRFVDARSRYANRAECRQVLEDIFASAPLAEWRQRLASAEGVWAPLQSPRDVHDDPQAAANGVLPEVEAADASHYRLVASPVHFDGEPVGALRRAPEAGEHTEQVLLEVGCSWDDLAGHKDEGVIL